MSIIDSIRQLEEQASTRVRELITELHQDARTRLEDELTAHLSQIRGRVSEGVETLSRAASGSAHRSGRHTGLVALRDSFRALDLASSQAEVLTALLAESKHFSSRAALFLLRGEQATGWNGRGFAEGAAQGLSIASPGTAFQRLKEEQSALRLDGEQVGGITGPLEAEAPSEAVLVPMVLRDKLAAALYADRIDSEDALDVEALQILVYASAQAIEVLPYRERSSTSTLALNPDQAPTTAESEASVEAVEEEAASVADAEPELSTWQGEPAPDLSAPAAEEAPAEAPVEATAEIAVEAAVEEVTAEALTEETEIAADEPPPVAEAAPQAPEVELPEVELPEVELESDAGSDDALQEVEAEIESVSSAAPAPPETSAESLQTMVIPSAPAQGAETPLEEAPPVEAPSVEPTPAPEDGESTTLLQRSALQPPLGEAPPPPTATPAPTTSGNPLFNQAAGAKDSQVIPPTDLDGPGLAFGKPSATAEDSFEGDENHDKAKRLARLLVSEIKLYNEEEVEEGRRAGNIYGRLKEDIDRSRQMYEDRVDERVRNAKDYFYQELVRTLASGDAQVLGL
ncbi:MAG: hypothetical protein AAGD01_01800 [Acidobacteriota bacterium]